MLAVCASVAQGAGYLCQHIRAAERPPVSLRSPVRTLASMLGSGWWRVGLLFADAGFLLHLFALAVAPISLVQAFVAGGLALVAPLAARVFHHRLTRAERRAVPLMAVSLAALSLGIANPPRPLAFDPVSLGLYLAVLLTVAALLSPAVPVLLGSRRWPRASSTRRWTARRRGSPTWHSREGRAPSSARHS